jgi:hypothetical protein
MMHKDKVDESNEIIISIGGDCYPTGPNRQLFANQIIDRANPDLTNLFAFSDYSIVNLEGPFIERETKIIKDGPVFGINSECVKGLNQLNVRAVTLANNHIMDHGEAGLKSTIDVLTHNNIQHVGAGRNINEASEWLIETIKGKRVAFCAMADREFSIADRDSWGANPTDVISFIRMVKHYKGTYDYLIVLLHEGFQHYPFPTPRIQQLCRFFIEEGASAVICQHSHCPGSFEFYCNRPIVYGQGDLISIFSKASSYEGFLVRLGIFDNKVDMEILPYERKPVGGVRLMLSEEQAEFIMFLEARNKLVEDPQKVEEQWKLYCYQQRDQYWGNVCGYNRVVKKINCIIHEIDRQSVNKIARLLNIIRCSAHREALEEVLFQVYKEKSDRREN